MKAIRIHNHGGIDVLSIDEIDKPKPASNEVLVQVKSASLNHLDLFVRNGFPGIPLPIIMGSDAAGIVVEIGEEVKKSIVGDEVFIVPHRTCGICPTCLSEHEQLCKKYHILGEHLNGCQAEYITVPEDYLLPKPKNISFEEAAAFPLAFMTAYHMLVEKAQIKSKQHLLIWGASSGIGSAAIQIAKTFNTFVITTIGNDEKKIFAEKLGADLILNYKKDNIPDVIKEITFGKGVDVIFEHPGKSTFPTSLRVLAMGGKIITCGATTGPIVNIDLRHLFMKHQQVIGSTMGNRENLVEISKLIEAETIKPYISHSLSYTDIQKAHSLLEEGKQTGKIVINFF